VQELGASVTHNVQSLVFRVPESISRDQLIAHLKANQVESTIGTYSLSATTYYQRRYADVQPISNMLNDNTITLPCYSGVDVQRVTSVMSNFEC